MSFTRLPPPGDRPALLNAPRETLLIRVSRCHLWLLRLLSQPAPPWPQEWLLQAAAPASLSARRVQPLEPIRSLLAPTPEQTVLIAATLAKPVSQISANAKTITEVGRKGAAVVFMDPLSYLFHTGNFGAGGIAIGKNSIGYNGSTVLGQHDYTGQIGDVNVNKQGDASNSYENLQYGFGATSVGYNSYTAGQYATSIGAYNVNSANYYPGGTNTVNGNSTVSQGFGATIIGSFNSNESRSSQSAVSGMANSLVGVANRVSNSSGALVFGAANQITNSLQNDDTLSRTPILPSSPVEFADTLRELVSQSNGGGSTLAIGGANTADWTNETAIIGVENSITGTAGNVSTNNMVNGYANKASNVNNVSVIGSENSITNTNTAVVVGDKRTLTGADNSVIIGSSSNGTTTSVKNAVAIGTESNATVEGGVALGAGSVASTDKGKVGYDPGTKAASTNTDSTWVSTRAAVSIGDTANGITRQITGLAAGTADTDAVNVAQLKVVKGDASQAVTESKKHSSVVAGNNIKVTSQANAEGGTEYSVSTADNVSFSSVTVGAASISQAGIQAGSQKITNVAPGTISATSTDAVNGSQLYQTNQAVQQNSDDISKLYNRSAELNRKIHVPARMRLLLPHCIRWTSMKIIGCPPLSALANTTAAGRPLLVSSSARRRTLWSAWEDQSPLAVM